MRLTGIAVLLLFFSTATYVSPSAVDTQIDYTLEVTVDVGSGITTVYAHSHSGDLLWGPSKFNCAPNTIFTWQLDPPR